jgi:hypothetical protein
MKAISRYCTLDEAAIDKWDNVIDWTVLSKNESINWSPKLLEKYSDRWNWENITDNESINWTPEMYIQFQDKLYCDFSFIEDAKGEIHVIRRLDKTPSIKWTIPLIEKYKNSEFWNWYLFSGNESDFWTEELIEKYQDELDWGELSANGLLPFSLSFIKKYETKFDWDGLFNLPMNHKAWDSIESVEAYKGVVYQSAVGRNEDLPWIEADLLDRWRENISWSSIATNKTVINSEESFYKYLDKWEKHDCFEELSGNILLPWKSDFINEYKDKWDWNKLSVNLGINWDEGLIDEFSEHLPFSRSPESNIEGSLSENPNVQWTIELLLKYEDKWGYDALAENLGVWKKVFSNCVDV